MRTHAGNRLHENSVQTLSVARRAERRSKLARYHQTFWSVAMSKRDTDLSDRERQRRSLQRQRSQRQLEPVNISIPETADLVGVGTTKIRDEIAAGNILARRCGRRIMVVYKSALQYAQSLPPATLLRQEPGTGERFSGRVK
jgi:hypothetical protein